MADDPTTPLFFGKLTFADDDAGSYHIGRRHVTDDAGEPMVLDWRAPLSRRSTRPVPGPAGRRGPAAVRVRQRELTGFEDEHLDRGEELAPAARS